MSAPVMENTFLIIITTIMIAVEPLIPIILMIALILTVIAAAPVTLAHLQKLKQAIAHQAMFILIISWSLTNAWRTAAAAATNIHALAQVLLLPLIIPRHLIALETLPL
jgi:hypothetical protein